MKPLEPSSCAALADGPKVGTPAADSESASPAVWVLLSAAAATRAYAFTEWLAIH